MPSFFLFAADSIVRELNEAPGDAFSQSIGVVERIFDPHRELPELQNLRIDVVAAARKTEAVDRADKRFDLRMEIAFRQVIRGEPESAIERRQLDELVALAEEVEAFFTDPPRRLKYADFAMWDNTELLYPYLPAHLDKKRQFTSLLRLTYVVNGLPEILPCSS